MKGGNDSKQKISIAKMKGIDGIAGKNDRKFVVNEKRESQ